MMKITYLGCLFLVAYATAGPIQVTELVKYEPLTKVFPVNVPNDDNKINICPYCVEFAEQALDQLMNIILEVGVLGTCNTICERLAEKTGSQAVGDVCTVLCDVIGVKEFIKAINKADLDTIYYCELMDCCPINDNADAEITSFTINPQSGPQGDFALKVEFTTENGTGTGTIVTTVATVDGLVLESSILNEALTPATYGVEFNLNTVPDPNCDITEGPCEQWLPGQYTVIIEMCEGECDSKHPHSKVLANISNTFKIVKNTNYNTAEDNVAFTPIAQSVPAKDLNSDQLDYGFDKFVIDDDIRYDDVPIPTGVSDGDNTYQSGEQDYEYFMEGMEEFYSDTEDIVDEEVNENPDDENLGYDEEDIYPDFLDDDDKTYFDEDEKDISPASLYDDVDDDESLGDDGDDINSDILDDDVQEYLGEDEKYIYPAWLYGDVDDDESLGDDGDDIDSDILDDDDQKYLGEDEDYPAWLYGDVDDDESLGDDGDDIDSDILDDDDQEYLGEDEDYPAWLYGDVDDDESLGDDGDDINSDILDDDDQEYLGEDEDYPAWLYGDVDDDESLGDDGDDINSDILDDDDQEYLGEDEDYPAWLYGDVDDDESLGDDGDDINADILDYENQEYLGEEKEDIYPAGLYGDDESLVDDTEDIISDILDYDEDKYAFYDENDQDADDMYPQLPYGDEDGSMNPGEDKEDIGEMLGHDDIFPSWLYDEEMTNEE